MFLYLYHIPGKINNINTPFCERKNEIFPGA